MFGLYGNGYDLISNTYDMVDNYDLGYGHYSYSGLYNGLYGISSARYYL